MNIEIRRNLRKHLATVYEEAMKTYEGDMNRALFETFDAIVREVEAMSVETGLADLMRHLLAVIVEDATEQQDPCVEEIARGFEIQVTL